MAVSTPSATVLYDAVGGAAGINVLVDKFYARLWADPQLKPYFEGIDKDKLKMHQRQFLQFATGGGPDAYTGKPLTEGHDGLGITDAAFDAVASHLWDTFDELDLHGPAIDIIKGFVEGARAQVVDRHML